MAVTADAPIGYGVLGQIWLSDIAELDEAEFVRVWQTIGIVVRWLSVSRVERAAHMSSSPVGGVDARALER